MSKRREAPKPWHPAAYEPSDIMAIKALAVGNANDVQQRAALRWIIEGLCGTYDQPFRPGPDGARETDFACAKQFVGQQIVKLVNLKMTERPGG